MTNIKDIIKLCRFFELDLPPDGWPAIQMCHITALCDEVERLQAQRAAMLAVLEELDECAAYWSEYDVPLGLHDRIKSAIKKARGEDMKITTENTASHWSLSLSHEKEEIFVRMLATLEGIAEASPEQWEMSREEFLEYFRTWAQSIASNMVKIARGENV